MNWIRSAISNGRGKGGQVRVFGRELTGVSFYGCAIGDKRLDAL